MFKNKIFKIAISFIATAAVATTATCTALYFTKWKNQDPDDQNKPGENKPPLPSLDKENFEKALNDSSFFKPLVFTLEVGKNENQEQVIIESLQTKWSGKANPIQIKQVGSEYVVSLNQNTNTYTNNIFGKVWADIMQESENADFKNIKQVGYGFRLVKQDEAAYQLVPTYIQVSFETKPAWLDKDSFRLSLLSNKDLISTINIK